MEILKTLIVDDEPKARALLKDLIQEFCPNIQVLAEAEDVKSAVKFLLNNPIDLVFLDIDMPNENGFVLFEYFENPTFETIFCTAHSDYALKAFEVSAIDYILKPISINKLVAATEKATKITHKNQVVQRIDTLKENFSINSLQKIALPFLDGFIFIKLDDVFYFEADGSYTNVITNDQNILVSKKLKDFDVLLSEDKRFFRIHRSFLVNIQQIKKYIKKDGATLLFENNVQVPIAREKKNEFDEFVGEFKV